FEAPSGPALESFKQQLGIWIDFDTQYDVCVVVHHACSAKHPFANLGSFLVLAYQSIGIQFVKRDGRAFHVFANRSCEPRQIGVVGSAGNVVRDLYAVLLSHITDKPAGITWKPGAVSGPSD